MPCSNCGSEKLLARGLCQPCYLRLRRTGSVARTYVRNTGFCSMPGCGKESFAKNLCSGHYQRQLHPLVTTWKLLRSRSPSAYPPEWDRFESFLKEVGERPGPKYQLRRTDDSLPWSKTNFRWLPPLSGTKDYYTPVKRSDYSREWNLQTRFKISGIEYDAMLAAQGGGCAICGAKASHKGRDGTPHRLAVDHDHQSGAVRGLLCVRCNRSVGYMDDRPERLRAAADYLDRHAKTCIPGSDSP